VNDPARLGWQPVVRVEQYLLEPHALIEATGAQSDQRN
jgi:hypothetical protein